MNFSKYFSAFTILAALTLSLPARADVAPEDQCGANDVGQACDNAVSDGNQFVAGVCKQQVCSHGTPDGAMTYACFRCEVVEQGMGGQPNEAGGAGGSGSVEPDVGGSSTAGAPAGGKSNGSAGSGTAGAKTGSSGASGNTKAASDDGGGCSVSQARGGAGLGAALAALGLMVAGLRRRRSLAS